MADNEIEVDGPPQSQSHFAKFENFTPDDSASFDHEFDRLALSQNWVPGSQEYIRERTIAIREELKLHYFPQSQSASSAEPNLAEEEDLKGYQELCREIGVLPSDSIAECKRILKSNLVNIIDLIDARRTGKKVEVWLDFEAFRAYTLQDGKRIHPDEAKQDGGHLASLLQYLRGRRRRRGQGRNGVISGRVTKTTGLRPAAAASRRATGQPMHVSAISDAS